jgi:AraC-like DNA-binding protein
MIWLDEGGRQRGLHLIAPPPNLRGVVEHLWVHRALPRNTWRVVPDVNAYVIFHVVGGMAGCRVVGARRKYCDIKVSGRELTIGVRLRPGVLPQLIRDSASQLSDRSEPFESVLGPEGRRLTDRLVDAAPGNRLPLLMEFLSDQLHGCGQRWPPGMGSVADLGSKWGLSRRAAYDRTIDAIGLAPKLAFRIQRLHKALFCLHTDASLADVALSAGYCDQSHLTRESVWLLGESPGEWLRRGCSIVQDSGEQTRR